MEPSHPKAMSKLKKPTLHKNSRKEKQNQIVFSQKTARMMFYYWGHQLQFERQLYHYKITPLFCGMILHNCPIVSTVQTAWMPLIQIWRGSSGRHLKNWWSLITLTLSTQKHLRWITKTSADWIIEVSFMLFLHELHAG